MTFVPASKIKDTIDEINKILSKTKYVIRYEINIREIYTIFRGKIIVMLWINESEYKEQKVIEILSNEKTIEEQVKELANRVNLDVIFDIYKG